MSPLWSSSTTTAAGGGEQAARAPGRARRGHRHAGRVVGAGLQEHRRRPRARARRASPSTRHPLGVDVDADHLGAELLEQVEQRRERRVLDDDAVAEADDHLGDPVERVHRPVDHGELLGRERPRRRGARSSSSGSTGVVEVAGRQRLAADLGDDRAEVGQQRRVGRAGGEVEREVARALGDAPVAAWAAGPGRLAHERAVPARGSIAPTAASVCQASLTVVGETPSGCDSSRTVGSRLPTASSPAEISRPIAAAMPAGAAVVDRLATIVVGTGWSRRSRPGRCPGDVCERHV